jgi:hypothetical protein
VSGPRLELVVMPGLYAVVRLGPRAKAPGRLTGFHSITRTDKELSIVCRQDVAFFEVAGTGSAGPAPAAVQRRSEKGFRCLEVSGPLPFEATGVLASLALPLARARIPILAISTFDTDYVLVREERLSAAVRALERAGHSVRVE